MIRICPADEVLLHQYVLQLEASRWHGFGLDDLIILVEGSLSCVACRCLQEVLVWSLATQVVQLLFACEQVLGQHGAVERTVGRLIAV